MGRRWNQCSVVGAGLGSSAVSSRPNQVGLFMPLCSQPSATLPVPIRCAVFALSMRYVARRPRITCGMERGPRPEPG